MTKESDFSWSRLLAQSNGWYSFLSCSESEADNIVLSAPRDDDLTVRIIRGTRCRSKDLLFREWAAALQFPSYFGWNWDAFDECVSDLSWLRARSLVILIVNSDQVLRESSQRDLVILLHALELASVDLTKPMPGNPPGSRASISLRVVFQSAPEQAEALREWIGDITDMKSRWLRLKDQT